MKWLLPSEKFDNKKIISSILESRGIGNIDKFLNPSLNDLIDPLLMYGAKDAATVIMDAVKKGKKIFIHGDFDVDGVTATTIMWDFLFRKLNADVTPYVPSRFTDGYGLSEESITTLLELGAELIITVDCGVKDVDIVKKYSDRVDFVITDHHTLLHSNSADQNKATKKVNDYRISKYAKAVVHPKIDPTYPFAEICGAVVSWKTCSAINELYSLGFDMNQYLELVTLGTICDVMPLVNENRVITHFGLQQLKHTNNVGLNALMNSADIKKSELASYHIGFVIGPRINAAGRIDHAIDAIRLLSTQSEDKANALAQKLNNLNTRRQDLTKQYFTLAEEMIKSAGSNLIHFIYGEGWPEGIIGLIAGKLSHSYYRPVLVGTKIGESVKGSARSIEAFHIADAFKQLDHLLTRHGGHAQAAGFEIDVTNIDEFNETLNKIAKDTLTEDALTKLLFIDAILEISAVNANLYDSIEGLQPFGQANEQPVFAFLNIIPTNVSAVGTDKKHVKFSLKSNKEVINAIAFGKAEKFSTLLSSNKPINVAATLLRNEWKGRVKIELNVLDIKLAD